MIYGFDNFYSVFFTTLYEYDWAGNNLYTIYYPEYSYYYYNVVFLWIHLTLSKVII